MTKIKMCGLSRPEDVLAAVSLNVDYIGFVFAKKSRRYVSCETAASLKKLIPENITAVGVFVDEDKEFISGLINRGIIEMIQLHGSEDEEYIKSLKDMTGSPVIKAFGIKTKEDALTAMSSSADIILLDSYKAGSGTVFSWDLAKEIKRPFFLAGGLFSDNVAGAVRTLNPYAVDVSSGIETDGVKDAVKMKEFANVVRNLQ